MTRELVGAGRIHADARNVDGRTLGEVGRRRERPGQEVILPSTTPPGRPAASRSCAATSRPRAGW